MIAQKNIQRITYKNQLVATIITPNLRLYGTTFFTAEDRSTQVGMHHVKPRHEWKPHTHQKRHILIESSEEVLYIIRGTIEITFFTENGESICGRIVNANDVVIFHSLGHGLRAVNECEVFEVKQGPYTQANKLFFKNNDISK